MSKSRCCLVCGGGRRGRGDRRRARAADSHDSGPAITALGTLAAAPVAAAFSGPAFSGSVWPAVIAGALLGAAAALAVLALPAAGEGIAIHAGLLWLTAVILTPLLPHTP